MNNQQIAKFLRECAQFVPVNDDGSIITYVVPGTNLKLSCKCSRGAVLNMAQRYEKGLPHSGCTGPLKVSPGNRRIPQSFSKMAVTAFLEDGEIENAEQYVAGHKIFVDAKR
ncbi:MAG: hypothetical protein ACRCVD_08175 [Halioglobus sp.]